jgi:hypothetical protein
MDPDGTHDVGMTCGAEEFEGPQGTEGTAGGDHLRAGKAGPLQDTVEGKGDQAGQEEEQAAALSAEGPGGEIQFTDIGNGGGGGSCARRAFLIESAWESGEALLLAEDGHGGWAKGFSLVMKDLADIVDREVLLAQGDDPKAEAVFIGCAARTFGGGEEERPLGIVAELVDEDPEAARGVAKAGGGFGGGESLDSEGAEGFILALSGVGGLKKVLGQRG